MFKEKIRVLASWGKSDGSRQLRRWQLSGISGCHYNGIDGLPRSYQCRLRTGSGQRTAGAVSGIPEAKCQTPGRLFLYFHLRLC